MKKSYRGVEHAIQETRIMTLSTFGETKKGHEERLEKLEACRACPVLGSDCPPGCRVYES